MSTRDLAGGLLGLALVSIPGVGPWLKMTAFTGFMAGASIAGMLFPDQAPSVDVGRMSDVRGTGSTQGSPIPVIFGRHRVGGTIIEASAVREVKRQSDDGGGGKK